MSEYLSSKVRCFPRPLLFLLVFVSSLVRGDGNLGCSVNELLCNPDEICYDDGALGRCLPIYDDLGSTDVFHYDLGKGDQEVIRETLQLLREQNFPWDHLFTQCLLGGILERIRTQEKVDLEICGPFKQLSTIESRTLASELMDPRDLAYVSYQPSDNDEDEIKYAQEVFEPPESKSDFVPSLNDNVSVEEEEELLDPQEIKSLMRLVSLELQEAKQAEARKNQELDEAAEELLSLPEEEVLNLLIAATEPEREPPIPSKRDFDQQQFRDSSTSYIPRQPTHPLPDIPGMESSMRQSNDPEKSHDVDSDKRSGKGEGEIPPNISEEAGPLYSRLQREDVKKPGPQITHHHHHHVEEKEEEIPGPKHRPRLHSYAWVSPFTRLFQTSDDEEGSGESEEKSSEPKAREYKLDIIDTSCVNVEFENALRDPIAAEIFVRRLEREFTLPSRTFANIQLMKDYTKIRFKVNPNYRDLNASMVGEKIIEWAPKLEKDTGEKVAHTEIGCGKVTWSKIDNNIAEQRLLAVTLAVCGALLIILLGIGGFFLFRRNQHLRDKLKNLTNSGVVEACRDYQDLCRARMSGGKVPEKVDTMSSRVMKEDGGEIVGSPHSTSSSTSSWCEEPVVSKMDISTGHIVLAYMEDHLKNKDRLDLEWKALCAYEAEPCATDVAEDPQNNSKNRYPECIPYDHSRILLNESTNLTGSNYINASSIMDHDPRNPAYIAAQGPLATTAADFWQMVWEQGSSIIVMLTRLSENGKEMCHRYWPEDGSQVYHIYEVHLVSEHIWCEDYLVRSFYLKNLQSGETRTVTQLHYQTWPDGGIPSSTRALLEFRRKMNKSYRGRSSPVVVHCSDGCGRTGTFILTDMVLNRLAKGVKEIDIAATLEHIRDQRPRMVSNKQEFEFALMAVADEVHAILKAMPSQT
ncbi:unnamed protein product [Cyprideis torosa]|uniref:Uncharacterized protein n=1 Tax=Cyprideis torosa TaxID=163714 RepID=A0A7R8WNK1_9CRUS|nr:unnamed protein product [Cyprideis torosa]CAG0900506.1 unnamed protein product [Cyprideis torosa]